MRAPSSASVINVKVMELEKSLLDTWKFLSRFLSRLTTGDNYSRVRRDKLMQTIQMNFSQKQNVFSQFFSAFFESALKFENFLKKMTLMAYVFPKLPTTKNVHR